MVQGEYPYLISFFTQEIIPEHRRFPFVEIVNVQPKGERKSYDVTEETNSFEVRVYVRYNRKQELETADLYVTENQIITLLKNATLSDQLQITSNFEWNRGQISNNKFKIYGIQSTLTVTITEKKSTSENGTLGGNTALSIGDDVELKNIPVLSSNVRNVQTNAPLHNTARELKGYAPIVQSHTRHYEIEWSSTIEEKLIKLKNSRDTIQIIDGTVQYNAVIGAINSSVRFDQLKTTTIQFDIF